jgi:hypothetical protein
LWVWKSLLSIILEVSRQEVDSRHPEGIDPNQLPKPVPVEDMVMAESSL